MSAAANADVGSADAGVRLARSQRVPDLTLGAGARRLEQTNDTAAIFSLSIPITMFNNGRAALSQATAARQSAEARRRLTALDVEQAIARAQAASAHARSEEQRVGNGCDSMTGTRCVPYRAKKQKINEPN